MIALQKKTREAGSKSTLHDMMKGGGVGGRKMLGPPPNYARKDKDEDLLLFREMHKREKERMVSLLQPVSDEFEPNVNGGGNYPLYRIASAKKGSGYDFLADSNSKNDYDWLKTPPATPLFPSLEMEGNAPELAIQRQIPILQRLSRFSDNSEVSKAVTERPKSPTPKPKILSLGKPSISPKAGDAKNSVGTSNLDRMKTSQFNITDHGKRSNMGAPVTKPANEKESHPNYLTSNLSKNKPPESKTKPRSRGVSPTVRSTIPAPAQISGFSDETPPNLRTDRSSSTSRGRPSNPTTLPAHSKPEPAKPIRRQSSSPSMTRGRKVEAKLESGGIYVASQRGRIQTGNGTQVFGSRMVDKVMNARKLGAEERELKPKLRGSESESSGFGRMMSKSLLDMALKHLDTKRDQGNFRHLGKHH